MLSRQVHDLVFQIYGNMLGVEPAKIPAMVASACAFDSLLVMGIAAFRWRKHWLPQTKEIFSSYWNDDSGRETSAGYSRSGPVHPAE